MARGIRLGTLRNLASAVRVATATDAVPLPERAASVPRLIKAVSAGEYRGTSVGRLAAMGGAALYLLSPVDLLPEGLLGVFGLADDAMVASWLLSAVVHETEGFLAWEKTSSNTVVPGSTVQDRPTTPPPGWSEGGHDTGWTKK